MEDVIYPCLECGEKYSCIFFLEDSEECVYDTQLRHQQLRENLTKLNSFIKLNKKNWDGYDANPIDNRNIDFIKTVLPKLKIQPTFLCPCPIGAIQLEWEDKNNYLELECLVFESGRIPNTYLIDILSYESHKEKEKEEYLVRDVNVNDIQTVIDTINDAIKNFESKRV